MSDVWDGGAFYASESEARSPLEDLGLRQVYGVPLDRARLVIVRDRSHAADQRILGRAIRKVSKSEDVFLVEGTNAAVSARHYGLTPRENVRTLDHPALFALAELVVNRSVRAKIETGSDPYPRTVQRVVVDMRNQIWLLRALQAVHTVSNNEPMGVAYLFGGLDHIDEEFVAALDACGVDYAVVEPEDSAADGTQEQNVVYELGFADIDQTSRWQQWHDGKDDVRLQLFLADQLIDELSSHPEDSPF